MSTSLTPESTMQEVLRAYPGARRALFRKYHIGGCSNCGFQMDETLGGVCARNENIPPAEVIDHILKSDELDRQMLISPEDYQKIRESAQAHQLIDIRSREEHEAVAIEGSTLLTRELMQDLMANADRSTPFVFFDHTGQHVLDVGTYFVGHGFTNVKCLQGGIDFWAEKIDSKMPRYQLEAA